MEQIFLSVSVFTVVVLILVLILNFAESQLLPQGDVTVEINGNPENICESMGCANPMRQTTGIESHPTL